MLSFTDTVTGAGLAGKINLSLAEIYRFATNLHAQGLEIEMRGIIGTVHFVAWE